MGNREKRQQKVDRVGKRVLHTLALLLIVNYSLLIVNCPNTLITSVVYGYNVTYLDYDGTYMRTQPIYKGYPIKRWSNPQKWGYTFEEWYDDYPTLKRRWDFNYIPQEDTMLYANWDVDIDSIIGVNGQPIPNNRITIRNGEGVNFQSASGFSDHKWMLNGSNDSFYNDSEWYYFTTSNRDKEIGKSYTLSLSVINDNDGINYISSPVTIRIPDAEITIRTQPKLNYTEGDMLDLSGLVVTLAYDDGYTENVAFRDFSLRNIIVKLGTSSTPPSEAANGAPLQLTHNNQQIIVSYGAKEVEVGRLTVGKRN